MGAALCQLCYGPPSGGRKACSRRSSFLKMRWRSSKMWTHLTSQSAMAMRRDRCTAVTSSGGPARRPRKREGEKLSCELSAHLKAFKGQAYAPFRSRASVDTALRALPTARLAALGRQHRTHSTRPAHESLPLTSSSGWATQIAMSPLNFLPPPAAPAPSWCLAACSRRARR